MDPLLREIHAAHSIREMIRDLPEEEREAVIATLSETLADTWTLSARTAQLPPRDLGWLWLFVGGRGTGKCLGRGTRLVRFDGSLVAVEDVRTGDLLMGPDSTPRRVMSTTIGVGPLYRVKQKTAIDYVANDAHILALVRSRSSGEEGRYPLYGDDPALITVAEYAAKSERFRTQFFGYKAGRVEFETKPVPLDPYFLGAWLGDGDFDRPSITTADEEVETFVRQFATSIEAGIYECKRYPDSACTTLIVRQGANALSATMRKLGLFDEKHIPETYLTNDEAVRLQVLAGLLDSDGYFDRRCNCYEITQKRERLAREIKRLADFLGFKTSIAEKQATCNGRAAGSVWRINISGGLHRIPCRVVRKQAPVAKPNKDWLRTRVDVEPIGDGEYFGFELDGDRLFLLEDGTVTHNTHALSGVTYMAVRAGLKRLHYIAPTVSDIESVSVMGPAGILATAGDDDRPRWVPSKKRLDWPNGAMMTFFSGEEPDGLRGPQCELCLIDELARMQYGQAAFDMAMMGLRLGAMPRIMIATTPRPTKLMKRIVQMDGVAITRGSTWDNAEHLAPSFLSKIRELYEGTRLGRQELEGTLLLDPPNALFLDSWLRRDPIDEERIEQVTVGVDPSGGEDTTGIVVCALLTDGTYAVLADRSCDGTPAHWGNEVIRAHDEFQADDVCVEINYGGAMATEVVKQAADRAYSEGKRPENIIRIQEVSASRGKTMRAEPISLLYEKGRVTHRPGLNKLEEEMLSFSREWDRVRDGSPNRLDAAVWGLTRLSNIVLDIPFA